MRRQLLHVEKREPVSRQNPLGGEQREIREVLVVDGVELVVLDEPQQVRELQRQNTGRFQKNPETFHEIVQVRYLRENVIPQNQLGAKLLCGQFRRQLGAEKLHQGWDPLVRGHLCHVGCWFNSQRRDAPADEILQ